jgi:ATP-binding cassette subfamily B protein
MLKRLLLSLREYKKPAALTPVYVTLESILEIFIPTLMALLIDNGVYKKDMNYILLMGLCLTATAGLSLLTGVLAGQDAAFASAGFAKNLRRDMF